jgi:hypothetical protein
MPDDYGDLYEKRHMTDEGASMLYRDKFVAPWPWHAIMGAMTALTIGGLALNAALISDWTGFLIGSAISIPIFAMLYILFSVLRVSVSTRQVQIQMGLFGPTIDVSSIIRCEAVEYDWKKFGGWGIRYAGDGEWAYNLAGDGGQAVRIVYHGKGGKETSVIVSSRSSEHLAKAINQAMTMHGMDESADEQLLYEEAPDVVLDTTKQADEVESVAEREEPSAS